MMGKAGAIRFTSTFVKAACILLLLGLAGCGRYADFTLPPLPPAKAVSLRVVLQPSPVIEHGPPGSWDGSDALNPSVVEKNGRWLNFYSGFDGRTWRTGLAESLDGVRWTKRSTPVLSPDPHTWEGNYIAANGSVLEVNGEFLYWYQSGPRDAPQIGLARSNDAVNWKKNALPVLSYGPRGSFDESAVADPYVIRLNGTFFLYYLGQNRARLQTLGLARSQDGVVWEKLRSNPLMDLPAPGSGAFDENGQGEPAVFEYAGHYWMLWTGRDAQERRALGMASSSDGVHWAAIKEIFRGDQPWNNQVVADPTVMMVQGKPVVWFGGGNQPSPDERLNGSIGIGRIEEKQ